VLEDPVLAIEAIEAAHFDLHGSVGGRLAGLDGAGRQLRPRRGDERGHASTIANWARRAFRPR
jgi:hypothetical protein